MEKAQLGEIEEDNDDDIVEFVGGISGGSLVEILWKFPNLQYWK